MSDTNKPLQINRVDTINVTVAGRQPISTPSPLDAAQWQLGTNTPLTFTPTHELLGNTGEALLDGAQGSLSSGGLGSLAHGAGTVGDLLDVYKIGQHMVVGRYIEATAEFAGAAAQGGGAALGGYLFSKMPFVFPHSGIVMTGLGMFTGSIGVGDTGKDAAQTLMSAAYEEYKRPPNLDGSANLKPVITTADGAEYALVVNEGTFHWYGLQRGADASLSPVVTGMGIVDPAIRAQLTDAYLSNVLPEAEYAQYQQTTSEIRQHGDTLANTQARIAPVGTVTVNPLAHQLTPDQVKQNVA